jgi:hypothetical protein
VPGARRKDTRIECNQRLYILRSGAAEDQAVAQVAQDGLVRFGGWFWHAFLLARLTLFFLLSSSLLNSTVYAAKPIGKRKTGKIRQRKEA